MGQLSKQATRSCPVGVHPHSIKFNDLLECSHRPATKDPTIGRIWLMFFREQTQNPKPAELT